MGVAKLRIAPGWGCAVCSLLHLHAVITGLPSGLLSDKAPWKETLWRPRRQLTMNWASHWFLKPSFCSSVKWEQCSNSLTRIAFRIKCCCYGNVLCSSGLDEGAQVVSSRSMIFFCSSFLKQNAWSAALSLLSAKTLTFCLMNASISSKNLLLQA